MVIGREREREGERKRERVSEREGGEGERARRAEEKIRHDRNEHVVLNFNVTVYDRN